MHKSLLRRSLVLVHTFTAVIATCVVMFSNVAVAQPGTLAVSPFELAQLVV